MTVGQLLEFLKDESVDIPIFISSPVQGDCENVVSISTTIGPILDDRYPAVVLFPD